MNWTMPDYNGNEDMLEEYTKQVAKYLEYTARWLWYQSTCSAQPLPDRR